MDPSLRPNLLRGLNSRARNACIVTTSAGGSSQRAKDLGALRSSARMHPSILRSHKGRSSTVFSSSRLETGLFRSQFKPGGHHFHAAKPFMSICHIADRAGLWTCLQAPQSMSGTNLLPAPRRTSLFRSSGWSMAPVELRSCSRLRSAIESTISTSGMKMP